MLRRTILGSSWPRTCLTVPARKSSFSSGQESSECDAFSPSVLLSAEHRNRVVDRLRGSPALRHNPSKVVRQAAVLVPLCVDQQGEVCLAFQVKCYLVSSPGYALDFVLCFSTNLWVNSVLGRLRCCNLPEYNMLTSCTFLSCFFQKLISGFEFLKNCT